MDIRLTYFNFMKDVMHQLACINMVKDRLAMIEKWTGIFTAVFSGAGIASWFIWDQWARYAAFAVAASQVVSVAMPYFKLRERFEKLRVASSEMQKLSDQMENLWLAVTTTLTDDEITNKMDDFRNTQRLSLERLDDCKPTNRMSIKAEDRVEAYARTHFYG